MISSLLTTSNTVCRTWFERDRAHVCLLDRETEDFTIVEFWDEEVQEAVEDGFLNPRDWHGSLCEYANNVHGQ